ncbi:hypothetical protein [Jannaschia aquimarina]|uniref:Nucleotidyltransferase domain protein n=1 Tax=Jannaschia aquimarina TaxID=935700 RepID=A0A0D1EHH9_9RHOB|nr:hypothetical protein [Jannaschia aquimarina]KIT17139.1 hypothetical protein jaqu_11010 [Jannaschia aquimarina]SNT29999.1 hypothetical protein SAMN05421775_110113 [Jannaschia aquimarina]
MTQTDLIDLARGYAGAGHVDALFLGGSYGSGTQDDWSDVDLVGICPAERRPAAMAAWRAALEAEAPLAHWAELASGRLSNAITARFGRADLYLVDDLVGRSKATLAPLHDPDGLRDALPDARPPVRPDPNRMRSLAVEFLRVAGLTEVGLGRAELVLMQRGLGMQRDKLMDMMLEGHAHRGGMLHTSKVLDAAEIATLAALPAPAAERDTLIAAQRALWETGVPVARARCAAAGADWPGPLEAAARDALVRAGVLSD